MELGGASPPPPPPPPLLLSDKYKYHQQGQRSSVRSISVSKPDSYECKEAFYSIDRRESLSHTVFTFINGSHPDIFSHISLIYLIISFIHKFSTISNLNAISDVSQHSCIVFVYLFGSVTV